MTSMDLQSHIEREVASEASVRVLHDLVRTRSVTGTERPAVEVFVEHAGGLGYDAQIDGIGNGIATRGATSSDAIEIVLLGHIDTVSGEIPVRIENGVLHGRGSVDAKGPLAAFLLGAADASLPPGVRVRVAAALGEEQDSPGAQYLRDRWSPDACFIGEPSGWDGVTLGYKGRLMARVEVCVPCGHSAGEDRSAPDIVMDWWREAVDLVTRLNGDRMSAFETIRATVVDMRTESDGLSDRAWLRVSFRLPTWTTPEGLGPELRLLSRGDGRVALRLEGFELPHRSDRNDAVARSLSGAIRSCGGRPHPKLKTGTSDMNTVAATWGCPIAAYGPGDSGLDHSPEERLDLAEFAKSIRVVREAVERLAQELVETRGE